MQLSTRQRHLLGSLFDLMGRLKLEVDEARVLRKTLGYTQEELKSLSDDIGARAAEVRGEEDGAIKEGVPQSEITKMEDFFKLGKVIRPDGWLPPK